MSTADIRKIVLEELTRIAPEIDAASIQPSVNLRDQLDLDSMDFLNFVLALHQRLRVEIPEADYARLSTLDGVVAYVASKAGGPNRFAQE